MSYLFSHINLDDTEHGFIAKAGQELVFEAVNEFVQRINSDMNSAVSAFVSTTTEGYKERYKMPGGGFLQERQDDGRVRNVRATGAWDVAYPIKDYGAAFEANDVALGYMTGQELSNHIQTISIQNANTVRHEVLKRLFNNVQASFVDPHHGTLLVEPLANGDTVVYPPAIGATTETTENHYIEAGYTAITDNDDPFVTIADKLESRLGTPTGGSNIAVFINNAQTASVRDLAAFVSVADMGINYGADSNLSGVPTELTSISSARVLGRHEEAGCWIVEWRYIPATYLMGIHLDSESPLKMRVDPSSTGLGRGLQMVSMEHLYPHDRMTWRHRFGVGVANRINGVVVELANGGTYTVPTQFA